MDVLSFLIPIFLIIALGATLRRTGFLSSEIVAGMNSLVYWVGLPCVLFGGIARARIDLADHGDAAGVLVSGMVLAILLGYGAAAALRVGRGAAGTFVQASFRGNLAFVGLPVLYYSTPPGDPTTIPIALVLLGVLVPIYNLGAVIALLGSRHGTGIPAMGRIFLRVLLNPLVIASLAGGAWALCGAPFPTWLDRTVEALGRMALPLALLGIGAALEIRRIRGELLLPVIAAGLIKTVITPAIGYALATVVGLGPEETRIAVVYLATPTATASFVLAAQLGGDRELAAGTVATSTLLSLPSLWVALWLL
jgi:hypothetical protein